MAVKTYYTREHEWVRMEDGVAVCGITDYAQTALGELVFVELPGVDDTAAPGDACAVVESVKAASDVYAPLGGTVTAVNNAVEDEPELANADPYGDAWLVRVRLSDAAELTGLMDAAAYDAHCDAR